MSAANIISLLGGLGAFLFGMKFMGEGLEMAAGNRMKDLLETLTQSVIDSSGKAIQASVEKALDDEARKLTDKMVYWYFK